MTTIKQECSRHNHPDLRQKGDAQGAIIEFDNPLSNSYGNEHPPLFLTPTPTGNLGLIVRQERYELQREDLRNLFVSGRAVSLWSGESLAVNTSCSRHPDGTGIILQIGDLEFIIPRDRFERVVRAEVPGLIVKPTGVTDV